MTTLSVRRSLRTEWNAFFRFFAQERGRNERKEKKEESCIFGAVSHLLTATDQERHKRRQHGKPTKFMFQLKKKIRDTEYQGQRALLSLVFHWTRFFRKCCHLGFLQFLCLAHNEIVNFWKNHCVRHCVPAVCSKQCEFVCKVSMIALTNLEEWTRFDEKLVVLAGVE